MTEHANFNELGQETLDAFENPPLPVPAGTWRLAAISGKYEDEKVDKNGNPYSRFLVTCRAIEPTNDVDEAEVSKADGDWQSAPLYLSFFMRDKRDKHKAVKALQGMGVETSGRSWPEVAALIKGAGFEFFGSVPVEFDDDGDQRNADVKFSHPVV